ncbi:MAG: hypothetical protein Q4B03_00870 [Lachnospiraceae bacterium]|nr:hypothetical protein [Lachnospiraceae bacterium]
MNDEMNKKQTRQSAGTDRRAGGEKVRKVSKKSKIAVSSGKARKKRVNSSLEIEQQASSGRSEPQKKRSVFTKKKSAEEKPERDLTTSSHTAQRIDRQRQKLRKERMEARKAQLVKQYIALGAAAVILILAVVLLAACPGKSGEDFRTGEPAESVGEASAAETAAGEDSTAVEEGMTSVSSSEVRHFSFRVLLSDDMAGDDSVLTINEFKSILQQLYDANYILVDFYNISGVQQNADGTVTYTAANLHIPEGKIPFVLSQRDASYSLDRVGKGYASRLVVTEDGQLTDEYQAADGTVVRGSYDIVTILEDFINEHPDFSHENARGVIGLTGYNGILGYRTTEILGKSLEEGNAYAVYGVYDVAAEIEGVQPVVNALKEKGWHFASYGYNYCSYGADYELVVSDMDAWMNSVSGLIGGTDILLFPCETDIGSWSEYKADNQKYQYLKGLGFGYFCIEEAVNPSWLQIRSGYVRQGIKEIDSYNDYLEVMGES